MILTLDIGNTNIKTALFEGMEMRQYWRISTDRQRSSDELGLLLMNLLQYNRIDRGQIDGIMMSSVVPQINFTVEHMCRNYFGIEPMKIEPGVIRASTSSMKTRGSWAPTASPTPWRPTSSTAGRASPSTSAPPRPSA